MVKQAAEELVTAIESHGVPPLNVQAAIVRLREAIHQTYETVGTREASEPTADSPSPTAPPPARKSRR